jgi:hypothetical protein
MREFLGTETRTRGVRDDLCVWGSNVEDGRRRQEHRVVGEGDIAVGVESADARGSPVVTRAVIVRLVR